jgi:hypothetical protein
MTVSRLQMKHRETVNPCAVYNISQPHVYIEYVCILSPALGARNQVGIGTATKRSITQRLCHLT